MGNNSNKFSYLHLHKKKSSSDKKISSNAKKITFVIFGIFLLLFPTYSPLGETQTQSPSFVQNIFNLYFFISNQTLGMIHEAGHGICYILPCPRFFMVINATIFQVGFPLGVAYYYARKDNLFAAYIGMYFTGFSLHYTAWYISTSHEGAMISASKSFLGVDGYHDFYYILSTIGLLPYDSLISGIVKFLAYALMYYAVLKMFFEAFRERQL